MLPATSFSENSVEPSDSEAELLASLRRKEAAAFEYLVRHHGPPLLSVIRRYLGCEELCQDVLQETFLAAFRALDRFQGESGLATWLHRISVNAALMKIRTRKRRPEIAIDDLLPKYKSDGHRENPGPAWRMTTESASEAQELQQLVRSSIDQLPDLYRVVILLRDFDGHSTKEAASILEVSEEVVKTRLHRARQALRELLDRHFGGQAQ
jgi:RNA polymerase sigma-70 factor (ECF subfamily)